MPEARNWGSVKFGGALVTAGGLIFVAAARDPTLRAFDAPREMRAEVSTQD